MERVRTLKNPAARQRRNRSAFSGRAEAADHISRGRSGGRHSAEADRVGLRPFWRQHRGTMSNRREAVVRFRVINFDAKLNEFQKRCSGRRLEAMVQRRPQAEIAQAKRLRRRSGLDLQTFNVRSKESLMRPEGMTRAVAIERYARATVARSSRPARECHRPPRRQHFAQYHQPETSAIQI